MLELSEEKKRAFYFKRWASLSAKIIRIKETIKESTSEQTQSFLREYLKSLEKIKQTEKTEINIFNYE